MFTRESAVNVIKKKVLEMEKVTAAWEGGSVATGFDDDYSDLDLCMICKDEHKEEVLSEMVKFLENTFGQENMYRLPEPTYHGFSQVFFKTLNTPDLFYVDFAVMGESVEDKYIEENRHGIGHVWVDKYKLDPSPRSHDKIKEVAKNLYNSTIEKDFILILELKKQIQRQIFSEAFPLYMSFIARCIVPLMNIKYRPAKADFGMRYIYRDYPKDRYQFIENALRVNDIESLKKYFYRLSNEYECLKDELQNPK